MTGRGDEVAESGETDVPAEVAKQKRRARVFGDVLPEVMSDERGDAWGDRDQGAEGTEDWLRRQVPPHHG